MNYSYGLIIIDCSMPNMNGYVATDKIRGYLRARNLPQPMIVACTGHTEDLFIKKAWRCHMDEVLPKPTNVKALKEVLADIIEKDPDSNISDQIREESDNNPLVSLGSDPRSHK